MDINYILLCNIVLITSPWLPVSIATTTTSDQYQKSIVCNAVAMEDDFCLTETTDTSTRNFKTRCAAECGRWDDCDGFLFNSTNHCKTYSSSSCDTAPTACTGAEVGDVYYTKLVTATTVLDCNGNGAWDTDTSACICTGGYTGSTCTSFVGSCYELWTAGYRGSSRLPFLVQPTGYSSPITIYCSFTNTEVRTFIAIYEGKEGFFNKTWDEYVNGFSDGDTEVWMGLTTIAFLSSAIGPTKFRSNAIMNGGSLVYQYLDFQVMGESTNFAATATLTSFSQNGAAADSLLTSEHAIGDADGCFISNIAYTTPFSAPDRDNDDMPDVSCAAQSGAGWWFTQCTPYAVCNPLGKVYTQTEETQTTGHMSFPYVDATLFPTFIRYLAFFAQNY